MLNRESSFAPSSSNSNTVPMSNPYNARKPSRNLEMIINVPGSIQSLNKDISALVSSTQQLESKARQKAARGGQTSSALTVVQNQQPLVDFGRLDNMIQPLLDFRISTAPSTITSGTTKKGSVDEYNIQEKIVADVISKTLDRLREEEYSNISSDFEKDWEATKLKLLQQEKPLLTTLPEYSQKDSLLNKIQYDDQLVPQKEETPKMLAYYKALQESRKCEKKDFIGQVDPFLKAVSEVGSNADVRELWSLIFSLLKTEVASTTNLRVNRARAARKYLEELFRKQLEVERGKKLPSNKIRGELILILEGESHAASKSGLTYLLARAGEWELAAKEEASISQKHAELVRKVGDFRYCDLLLSEKTDRFGRTIERLNNFKSEVQQTAVDGNIEDYLWFRLCAIGSSETDSIAEQNSKELASQITSAGPDHFGAGANPFFYARILTICGEVEKAIDFLASFSTTGAISSVDGNTANLSPLPDAVHISIVMKRAHLEVPPKLSISSSSSSGSTFLDQESSALCYSKLVEYYASLLSDTSKAMDYVTYMNEEERPAKRMLSRPYGGPLLKVLKLNAPDKAFRIAYEAAKEARPTDAINLYYESLLDVSQTEKLGSFIDQAIHLINQELTRLIHLPAKNEERKFWMTYAENFLNLLGKKNLQLESANTLQLIQSGAKFYEDVEKGDEDASSNRLGWLFPKSYPEFDRKVVQFKNLDHSLIDSFPVFVSWTIKCHELAYRKGKKEQAKERLQILVAFIACLREKADYRLRSDIEKELAITESRICV